VIRERKRVIAITFICALITWLAVNYHIFDRLFWGAAHGQEGLDFFSIPRAFLNLHNHKSIFDTAASTFGPYATLYYFHPFDALAIGSWASQLSPGHSLGLFRFLSIALLAACAFVASNRLSHQLAQIAAPILLFLSFPTYLMLWIGQLHVATLASLVLILAAMKTANYDRISCHGATLVILGTLISLLSKPMILLAFPALLCLRPLRRPLLISIGIYILVSWPCLQIRVLNPQNDNFIHWSNILFQLTAVDPNAPEVFSFPILWSHWTGVNGPSVAYRLPLTGMLALAAWELIKGPSNGKVSRSVYLVWLAVCCHFLCYTLVYEYHYATITALLPFVLDAGLIMPRGPERIGIWIALAALCTIYLPTPYFFYRTTLAQHIDIVRAWRVLPLIIAYGAIATSYFSNWHMSRIDLDIPNR
jgi:hypothetical protein